MAPSIVNKPRNQNKEALRNSLIQQFMDPVENRRSFNRSNTHDMNGDAIVFMLFFLLYSVYLLYHDQVMEMTAALLVARVLSKSLVVVRMTTMAFRTQFLRPYVQPMQ